MLKLRRLIPIAGLAAVMISGSAHAATQDAWITTKAKLTLYTTEGVSGTSINVDTIENKVTLHGKVASEEEKAKAEAVVSKIDGVTGVRNLLQVVPPKHEKSVQIADAKIKTQIEKALTADKGLADSKIEVQSVNDGVALLSGKATTLTDHLRAVEIAATVPGVRRVVSEVEGPDNLAVGEIWVEPANHKAGSASVTNAARDAWITSSTKILLLADSATPALDINVDTRDGVVTLFGVVPSKQAKAAAEADARKVSGVKHVLNELEIVPQAQAKAVEVRDDQLQEQVKTTLRERDTLKDVSVEVKNGVARLTGKVPSGEDRLDAAVLARATIGVRSVRDELVVAD